MSTDNLNKKPDNSTSKDDELTAILQRLSDLLDKSVSLDEAVELAKKQGSSAESVEQETQENELSIPEQVSENNGESAKDLTETDNENHTEEANYIPEESSETDISPTEEKELNSYAELIKKLQSVSPSSVQKDEPKEDTVGEDTKDDTQETVDEPETISDKNMPVSDFLKLLKSRHFTNENGEQKNTPEEAADIEETPVEEATDAEETPPTYETPVSEKTFIEQQASTVEEAPVKEALSAPEETPTPEETSTQESPSDEEETSVAEEISAEKSSHIAEEISNNETDDEEEDNLEDEFATSKIFDELLACFDDHKLPDDFRFSEYNASEQEKTETAEDSTQTEEPEEAEESPADNTEEENEPAPEFVPIEHENPKEDDLFSKIFSEEKSERKNRENDKKKWQNLGIEPSPFLSGLFDWLEVIVLSAAFALLLFTFILRLAVVDGDSMNHTLHDKDLLIISDLMYSPENNDIIVFTSPNYPEPIVKRVIATEGQTVDIDFETWTVKVDGVALKEDYINRAIGSMNKSDVSFPLTVPEGYVFVMGDNRNESLDSRNSRIGFVDERYILGEVILRLFPLDKFGKVN